MDIWKWLKNLWRKPDFIPEDTTKLQKVDVEWVDKVVKNIIPPRPATIVELEEKLPDQTKETEENEGKDTE